MCPNGPIHAPPRRDAAPFDDVEGLFSAGELEAMGAAIRSSPRLQINQLGPRFSGSYGFSVVFTRAGVDAVTRALPGLAPYLGRALKPDCNAFYLNPLVLDGGARVGAHVDTSLSEHLGERRHPERVSVLYIEVPEGLRGGALILARARPYQRIARIEPRVGALVTFDGELVHEVERLDRRVAGERVSLVCEQYALPPSLLARVPAVVLPE